MNRTSSRALSGPGFLVMDSGFRLLSFNQEAVKILTYASAASSIRNLFAVIAEKVRATLLSPHDNGEKRSGSGFVPQFKSGRRQYVCRAFSLEASEAGDKKPAMLVVLDRDPGGAVALSRIAEQFQLTQRERETVAFLLEGLTSKEMAVRMAISPNTVKAFLRVVMIKMGVSTRSGIVAKVLEHVLAGSGGRGGLKC